MQRSTSRTPTSWLHLNAFRGEPAISTFDWHFTSIHSSSPSFAALLRGAFHVSLTVLVHYRLLKVFSLGGWSPQLPTRFHVPRGTQDANPVYHAHPLLDSRHLRWRFPTPLS